MNSNNDNETHHMCEGLEKVLIPAILGDENGDYAPQNGIYKSALVEYERSGSIYVYTADGVYTKIK